jgi:hypothetical protein
MRVIRQNYGMALGVNSVGLVMAAAGTINPIIAALLHNLSTILVIFNSARLIHYSPPSSAYEVMAAAQTLYGPIHGESESEDYSGGPQDSSGWARNSSEQQELQ